MSDVKLPVTCECGCSGFIVKDADGKVVAGVVKESLGRQIVTAMNSHAALVEVVKREADGQCSCEDWIATDGKCDVCKAHEALALAEPD